MWSDGNEKIQRADETCFLTRRLVNKQTPPSISFVSHLPSILSKLINTGIKNTSLSPPLNPNTNYLQITSMSKSTIDIYRYIKTLLYFLNVKQLDQQLDLICDLSLIISVCLWSITNLNNLIVFNAIEYSVSPKNLHKKTERIQRLVVFLWSSSWVTSGLCDTEKFMIYFL